jgi:hypothetical protein
MSIRAARSPIRPATEAGTNPVTEESASTAIEVSTEPAPQSKNELSPTPNRTQKKVGRSHNSPSGEGVGADEAYPVNHAPSPTDASLALMGRTNGIDRNPDNSEVAEIESEQYSEERIGQLINKWNDGAATFWASYDERCLIVYQLHQECAKPGCRGGFSAVLRRIKLPSSTAFDMVSRYRIQLGLAEDPDALDSRDEDEVDIDQLASGAERHFEVGDQEEREYGRTQTKGRPRPRVTVPKAVIPLSGEIAEAVRAIQSYYHKSNAKEVFKFCVLRVYSNLKMPFAHHYEDDSSLMLAASEEDADETTGEHDERKTAIPDYQTHCETLGEANHDAETA